MTPELIRKQIAQRLAKARRDVGMTQQEVAKHIGVTDGTISNWEHGYRQPPNAVYLANLARLYERSSDWLLALVGDLDDPFVSRELFSAGSKQETGSGLKWRTLIPYSHSQKVVDELSDAIAAFELAVRHQKSLQEIGKIKQFAAYPESRLKMLIRLALVTGHIQVSDVEENDELANLLKEAYQSKQMSRGGNLSACFVAKTFRHSANDEFVDAMVRTEAVAFLAAKRTLPYLEAHDHVGISGGITMARFVDYLPPGAAEVRRAKWYPLLVSKPQGRRVGLSANSNITRLLYRQQGVEAFRLSFVDDVESRKSDNVLNLARRIEVAFISVGGKHHDPYDRFAFLEHGEIASLLGQMTKEEFDNYAGDILLNLVDDHAERIGSDELKSRNDALVHSIGLDGLRSIVARQDATVWIFAAQQEKAPVVNGAIKARYANCLVIDDTVGTELLHLARDRK